MAESRQETTQGASKETTISTRTPPAPFSARVESIWKAVRRAKRDHGFIAYLKERSRVKAMIQRINDALRGLGLDAGDWDREQGETVCHMNVDRLGLLSDLHAFAREGVPAGIARQLAHLHVQRDKDCLYLPLDFGRPILLPNGQDQIPVGSAARLRLELGLLEKHLHTEKTFAAGKMVNYMNATEQDILKVESRAMFDPLFWTKFGFVVLRKLADASVEHRLPVVFA